MLQEKRGEIRRRMRGEEVGRLFAMRRKSLLEGQLQVSRELFAEVEASSKSANFDLMSRLVLCLKLHPEDENAYILIINFLIDHSSSYSTFLPHLLAFAPTLPNHGYALVLIAHFLGEEAREKPQSALRLREELVQIVLQLGEAAKIVLGMNSPQRPVSMWIYFMDALKLQLGLFDEALPVESARLFVKVAERVLEGEGKQEEVAAVWLCGEQLMGRLRRLEEVEELEEQQVTRQVVKTMAPIILAALRSLPHERERCIAMLQDVITLQYPGLFHKHFLREDLLLQFFYLLEQVAYLKIPLLKVINKMLSQVNVSETIGLLRLGLHRHLTTTLGWAVRAADNECVEVSLNTIYGMLMRLKDEAEVHLLDGVLSEMQQLEFQTLLQELTEHEKNGKIRHQLNLIIDDFYSEEVHI